MDQFKQYLQKHTEGLGSDEPGVRVWQNIQNGRPVAPKRSYAGIYIKYAVAACIIALTAFGFWYLKFNNKPSVAPATVAIANPVPVIKTKSAKQSAIIQKRVNVSKPLSVIANANIKKQAYTAQAAAGNNEMKEFKNVEASFTSVINMERYKINSIPLLAENSTYFNYFIDQFSKINSDEEILKKDIHRNGLNNGLLLQLINIYQQKLNVLKALQTEINKTNNQAKDSEQPAHIKTKSFINI